MIRPGLCSVTYRDLSVEEIIALASAAGLAAIEWGADVHVAAGDVEAAGHVRSLTEGAGLAVASYGTYLRLTGADVEHHRQVEQVLASAAALGAPRLRIWAGETGSADTDGEDRARMTRRLEALCARAADLGLGIGLEHHRGTLTDDLDSSLRLLADVGHPALTTYWQPNLGQRDDDALDDLRRLMPHLSTVHVFSWWPWDERLPLAARQELWARALREVAADGRDHDALLEFVPGDDPALLEREAATLRELIAAATA